MLRLFVFVCMFVFSVDAAVANGRTALVIGNGAYQAVPALPNPPRDAADIASALKRLDFNVTELTDANSADLKKAIAEFGKTAAESEMAVVFYAGHGMEASGENWLIPIDAKLVSDTDTSVQAINLKTIMAEVSKAKTFGLVILDACRNNPFVAQAVASNDPVANDLTASNRRLRSVGKGLAPTEAPTNVLVAFAAKDGTVANDGDARNSPFTEALLRHIETSGLEVTLLFRSVRDDVIASTGGSQQPYVYGSLSKDQIFLKPPVNPQLALLEQLKAAPPNPLFREGDAMKVASVAKERGFINMPLFEISELDQSVPTDLQRFVGIWSSKVGYGSGVGRQAMLIVTHVSSDAELTGYFVWGPATKQSFGQFGAGYKAFTANIVGSRFKIDFPNKITTVAFGPNNTVGMQDDWKDGKSASIVVLPVWTLTTAK
jgi:hypothetical protein